MKTKIIYISGNEIFDMNDIRAAFEEVRNALNLDKTTVLFGVPVDCDDAGFATTTTNSQPTETTDVIQETEPVAEITEIAEITEEEPETLEEPEPDIQPEIVETETISQEEEIVEKPVKKRGRPRKTTVEETIDTDAKEPEKQPLNETPESTKEEEKVVPILSILSGNDDNDDTENIDDTDSVIEETTENEEKTVAVEQISIEKQEINIIHEIPADESEQPDTEPAFENNAETDSDEESLEKLLSAMTPLQEDVLEEPLPTKPSVQPDDISVDATLQQLASEFAENQDKISAENKNSSRSKIGKLRNILPFKQSKHKDQGLGDLFGWAGIAANDEDFSVPGFFTNVASKK